MTIPDLPTDPPEEYPCRYISDCDDCDLKGTDDCPFFVEEAEGCQACETEECSKECEHYGGKDG